MTASLSDDGAGPAEASHPGLSADEVLAGGGWDPRYTRVVVVASDGDSGFALVDGNGDGRELEAEIWFWDEGVGWAGGDSMGAGALSRVGSMHTSGQINDAYFAYGRLPGRTVATIQFEERAYDVPVSQDGFWAFIRTCRFWAFIRTCRGPGRPGGPALVGWA